jgi:hypothetical protein
MSLSIRDGNLTFSPQYAFAHLHQKYAELRIVQGPQSSIVPRPDKAFAVRDKTFQGLKNGQMFVSA